MGQSATFSEYVLFDKSDNVWKTINVVLMGQIAAYSQMFSLVKIF